jgi:hypothetical protein
VLPGTRGLLRGGWIWYNRHVRIIAANAPWQQGGPGVRFAISPAGHPVESAGRRLPVVL